MFYHLYTDNMQSLNGVIEIHHGIQQHPKRMYNGLGMQAHHYVVIMN